MGTYPGGKNGAGVYQNIINRMPPHRVYVEPFLGGGAIMRLKRPAELNVGIDLEPGVIAGFGAGRRAAGPSPETTGSDRLAPEMTISPETPIPAIARPESWFIHGDGIGYLERKLRDRDPLLGPGTLVYCDPPYMHETRGRADIYRHELTNQDHLRLLGVLVRLPCMVIVSGYWTKTYSEALKGWNTATFQTTNRAGNVTEEWLWFNYPAPQRLHDYRYLGKGFRERERIKRKKARWIGKLDKMPELERYALLGAIDEWERGSPSLEMTGPAGPAGNGD